MSTINRRDIFPFMKLPAKLRDAIYDECLVNIRSMERDGSRVRFIVEGTICPNLSAVSRQVHKECRARSKQVAMLTTDRYLRPYYEDVEYFDPPLKKATNVNPSALALSSLRVCLIFGTNADLSSEIRFPTILKMLEDLPNFKSVHLCFTLTCYDLATMAGFGKKMDEDWVNIAPLQSIRLYSRGPDVPGQHDWEDLDKREILMEWVRKVGKWRRSMSNRPFISETGRYPFGKENKPVTGIDQQLTGAERTRHRYCWRGVGAMVTRACEFARRAPNDHCQLSGNCGR